MEENSLFFNWFFFKLPIGTVPEATPIPDEIVGILHSAAPIFSALVGLTLGILAFRKIRGLMMSDYDYDMEQDWKRSRRRD